MQYRGDDDFTELRSWFSRLLDQAGWFDQELADSRGGSINGASHCTAANARCRGAGTVAVRAPAMSVADTGWLLGVRRRRRRVRVVGRSWIRAAAAITRAIGRVVNPTVGAARLRSAAATVRVSGWVDRTPVDEEELLLLDTF